MGAVVGAAGAQVLRVGADGRGRQPALLRVPLLQRDRRHHAHQARRRGELMMIIFNVFEVFINSVKILLLTVF